MSYQLPGRTLVSQSDSAMIPKQQIPRSVFRNQYNVMTAFDAGLLVPIVVHECLPGDHMTYEVTPYVRMSTLIFPMYSEQRIDTHFFFVPNRLVWTNWPKLMGERETPFASVDYTTPVQTGTLGGDPVGSLPDYFGIPTDGQIDNASTLSYNALPFRAYALIWNTWFRDQNVNDAIVIPMGDGPDPAGGATHINVLRRAKSHDYFTSCLPFPSQQPIGGGLVPLVPLQGSAPVYGLGFANNNYNVGPTPPLYEAGQAGTITYPFYKGPLDATGAINQLYARGIAATSPTIIYAGLDGIGAFSINSLRSTWAVTQMLERDARGGGRYIETIREHFGVVVPDYRLQRPEYIGGGQTPLNITPIAQTAPTTGVPLGALGAAATAAGTHRASYAAQEHGFIIGVISIKTELAYQQGLHRKWTRRGRTNYYIPALADLGEQAVLNQEIYCDGTANDALVFGYQERWHEYRTEVSQVTGIMRSTAFGTIDQWHLAQRFTGGAPALVPGFIADNPPTARAVAAGALATGQTYIADILIQRTAVRPVPTFNIPAQLGRF